MAEEIRTRPGAAGGWLERRFALAAHGTTPRREFVAGLTTFVTMAYVLFVNTEIMRAAGIGLFIAFIGLVSAGIVQFRVSAPNGLPPGPHVLGGSTGLPTLGTLSSPSLLLTIAGLVLTAFLMARGVRGALLLGMAATTVLAWVAAATNESVRTALQVRLPGGIGDLVQLPDLATWQREGWLRLDFAGLARHSFGTMLVIFLTFLITDMLDTFGSFSGLASKLGILDERGDFPNSGKALVVDAAAGAWGPIVGTATVVTYIESAAGVGEGGRTGLTACWVAILFLACLFFVPLVGLIPAVATAPALILVGLLMMEPALRLRLDDVTEGLPAFLTLLLMPLTYNIAEGMLAGVLMFVALKLLAGRAREVSGTMWALSALLLLGKVLEGVLR